MERKDEVFTFIKSLPAGFQFFTEFRNPVWLLQSAFSEELMVLLSKTGTGLVITDTPGLRSLVHFHLPVPKLMVRFVCLGCNKIDVFRIGQWKHQVKKLADCGLQELFFFMHIHNEAETGEFTGYVKKHLNDCFE